MLDDISLAVRRGESFGLVGESGCGKSTLARCLLRLLEPTSGRVLFEGQDLAELDREELRAMRKRMQFVFQDPFASLDPRMTAGALVEEPLLVHEIGDREQRRTAVLEMLADVGLTAEQAERRPHAFSGGQRQRIGIARAFVLRPDVVILDEPISALDVSVQAQVLNLLRRLQTQLGLTYVFITTRPRRRRVLLRPRCRALPRPGDGARRPRDAVPQTAPPLLGVAALGRSCAAGRRTQPAGQARAADRRNRLGRGPAAGLPVRATLSRRAR